MVMTYKLIDHTADFGIHVLGTDPKDLFQNAARAMFEQIAEIEALAGTEAVAIHLTGKDWPDLMVNWLRELLYYWHVKGLLLGDAQIQLISDRKLLAQTNFDPYVPDRHVIKREIKAVTYHQIQVKRGAEGWESKIIFDV